jgi:Holliday junction resolvase RusA-like endonuclease
MTTVTIELAVPPSVNRIWRVGAGGRVYCDPKYLAWRRTAGWEIMATRPGRFPAGTKVAVAIRAGKAKRARDLDNFTKAICDILQAHRIVANDRDVHSLAIAWDAGIEPGQVHVEVRPIERAVA